MAMWATFNKTGMLVRNYYSVEFLFATMYSGETFFNKEVFSVIL